ncbi:class I mannose-6-phosphate isomerase [Sphingobium sp. DEHP117]|uniref:class I mannose-6-phosphate isomerase n=1 Tax=Sphingobium sp. DEHP117 TaxID=2993436 RepID=UPI0027D592F5|nr:class I mannose-6-phosphate isomerase [Sphingobium sp. DEHP117]MDQ4421846.1 class I mannose-6-phosphate isomerase [Sphingobium sp. DEHP117]
MSALLPVRTVEKPWGRTALPKWVGGAADARIGEVWFEPPSALDSLLVKYIFTGEKLSVQVHPSDKQTLERGLGRQGKEECWLVLGAEPGAKLGIGFREQLDAAALRQAALDGSIEQRLVWRNVKPGDFFYIPANTVHAIGAGISLIEVQQNSDITYRLYDYGRPRELHLDEAVDVAAAVPYADPRHRHVPERGEYLLVDGPLFRLLRYDGPLSDKAKANFAEGGCLVVPCSGDARVSAERVIPGQCALVEELNKLALSEGATGLLAQPIPLSSHPAPHAPSG